MKYITLSTIQEILHRVEINDTGIFSKEPELIVLLNDSVSTIIKDNYVCISEFILAKVQGKIGNNNGHPEITKQIFHDIPTTLNYPSFIYIDERYSERMKYLFIGTFPLHQVVIEVRRFESGVTEINSIIPLGNRTLKQLGNKFQAVYSTLY